jgi:hypothetical protein
MKDQPVCVWPLALGKVTEVVSLRGVITKLIIASKVLDILGHLTGESEILGELDGVNLVSFVLPKVVIFAKFLTIPHTQPIKPFLINLVENSVAYTSQ